MKKDEFKEFVKKHPILSNYVNNKEMTWQQFYEIYDLYGDNNEIWDKYINKQNKKINTNEIEKFLKNINLDSLQESITSIQRVLGLFSDLANKKDNVKTNNYEPKPIYQHFDD